MTGSRHAVDEVVRVQAEVSPARERAAGEILPTDEHQTRAALMAFTKAANLTLVANLPKPRNVRGKSRRLSGGGRTSFSATTRMSGLAATAAVEEEEAVIGGLQRLDGEVGVQGQVASGTRTRIATVETSVHATGNSMGRLGATMTRARDEIRGKTAVEKVVMAAEVGHVEGEGTAVANRGSGVRSLHQDIRVVMYNLSDYAHAYLSYVLRFSAISA